MLNAQLKDCCWKIYIEQMKGWYTLLLRDNKQINLFSDGPSVLWGNEKLDSFW